MAFIFMDIAQNPVYNCVHNCVNNLVYIWMSTIIIACVICVFQVTIKTSIAQYKCSMICRC